MSQPGGYPAPYPGWAQPAPPPMRPSGWWIVAGALVMVVGVVGAISVGVAGIVRMSNTVNQFQRVDVPGSGDLQLAAGRGYTVYFEYPDASSDGLPEEVRARLVDPAGQVVQMQKYGSQVTYQFGNHAGRAGFSFQSGQAGTYHLTTLGGPGVTLAVGGGLGSSIAGTILIAGLIGVIGFLVGLATILTAVIRRSRSRPHRTH